MSDETPIPVDPARVRAVLAVMGWYDDREHTDLAGVLWELAEEVIRAADAASPETHVIDIRPDGWDIRHPTSCPADLSACPLRDVTGPGMAASWPPAPPGRYECFVNDLGDRFLLGDRVDQEEVRTDG
ncbi:hypothetical protein [Micromonospora aurantiaca (nom. illeg.)]|uniref:hypothetical protein n=1 Tax=Micromonospora aurantiaca (nom. illeg.) TaxID=47850 RepID=UPI003F4A4C4E